MSSLNLASCLQSTEDYIEVLLARLDALRRRRDEAELRAAFRAAVELLQAHLRVSHYDLQLLSGLPTQ